MGKLEMMKQLQLLACIVDGKAQIIIGDELPHIAESDIVFRSPSCTCGSRLAITSKDELKKQLYQRLADFGLLCYYLVAKDMTTEEHDVYVIEVIIDGEIIAAFDKKNRKYVENIEECSV